MSQNYKDTLNLPRTDFPMKANLAQCEPELLKKWEGTRGYQQIQKPRRAFGDRTTPKILPIPVAGRLR